MLTYKLFLQDFINVRIFQQKMYLVMELCVFGELKELLNKDGPFTELTTRHICNDLTDAIVYLHKDGTNLLYTVVISQHEMFNLLKKKLTLFASAQTPRRSNHLFSKILTYEKRCYFIGGNFLFKVTTFFLINYSLYLKISMKIWFHLTKAKLKLICFECSSFIIFTA